MSNSDLVEIVEVLEMARIGRLALCDDGVPYIVPLSFKYHDGKIFFHCGPEGRKMGIIAESPNACFEADETFGEKREHYGSLCHLDCNSVLAFGKARVVEESEEELRLFRMFVRKYRDEEITAERVKNACLVVIEVHEMTGREVSREKTMMSHR